MTLDVKSVDLSGAGGAQDITFTNQLGPYHVQKLRFGSNADGFANDLFRFFLLGQGESALPSRRKHIRGGKGRSKASVRDSVADGYWDWVGSHLDCGVDDSNNDARKIQGCWSTALPVARKRRHLRHPVVCVLSLGTKEGRVDAPSLTTTRDNRRLPATQRRRGRMS